MRKLETISVTKPWGRTLLPEPFGGQTPDAIGEIWFRPDTAIDSILVKYIFTSEALSIQVHPSDAQTLQANLGKQGKEECWLVLQADPGATLGIGFARDLDRAEATQAVMDGSIEQLLTKHPVKAGDFFYIPANTVHAIGAGITLLEVQQNSDITYRLYDYGRPRELHLEEGLAVSDFGKYSDDNIREIGDETIIGIVEGPHFVLDQVCGMPCPATIQRHLGRPVLILPRRGKVMVQGESLSPGECGVLERLDACVVQPDSSFLVIRPV